MSNRTDVWGNRMPLLHGVPAVKGDDITQNCVECGCISGQCDCDPDPATAKNGDKWTGEHGDTPEWWIYRDKAGSLYESKEIPAYRIYMDNARLVTCEDGSRGIAPLSTLKP